MSGSQLQVLVSRAPVRNTPSCGKPFFLFVDGGHSVQIGGPHSAGWHVHNVAQYSRGVLVSDRELFPPVQFLARAVSEAEVHDVFPGVPMLGESSHHIYRLADVTLAIREPEDVDAAT
ncbi:hypothetical protein GCM10010977_22020 [Citricoccus zhacaiensis]|uniref:Uncharacterized protein n=1 Tax=Citricoccus zhacaiensis TaxID=489142 RepID=A0ABQ2M423_9MICC|nr:hypothetical protein GCM10010977_22020 [Citricoccus zhacaiensis]